MHRHSLERHLALVICASVFTTGCVKIQDAPRVQDTLSTAADSSPIRDKSLRPPPEGGEPFIPVGHMPDTGIAPAARPDTALATPAAAPMVAVPSPSVVAATIAASVVAVPVPLDETSILRRELGVPVSGVTASALHDTYNELRGGTRPHEALDIMAARGTPVLSASKGRVLKLFNSKPGGLMVYAVDSTERYILKYGHLDAYAPGLVDGQTLVRGQQIGIVGTTGNAAPGAPHLHFAMARAEDVKKWWMGASVNPYPLLKP